MLMEEAFIKLSRKDGGEKLLKATRDAYWRNLIEKQEQPSFEKNYLALKKYLDDSAVKITKSNLRQAVRTYCVEDSKKTIAEKSHLPIPYTQQSPADNRYLEHLISWTQSFVFQEHSSIFDATYEVISTNISLLDLMMSIKDLPSKMDRAMTENVSSSIQKNKDFLNRTWKFFLDGGILNSDEISPFDNIAVSAEDFSQIIKNAIDFFDIRQHVPYDYTSANVKLMLESQKNVKNICKWDALTDYCANCQIPLLCGILFVILHRLSMDVEERLMQKLPIFIEKYVDDEEPESC